MSKAEVNNQVVLMRKDVDQAKVHIIKKLTREIKLLRNKKGTDAQKAKNQRKADRYAAEILAVKRAKRDEITHFALTNSLTLKEILGDPTSDPLKRMKAKIANDKKFSEKIAKFKESYPNYLKLIEPGRKKRVKLERKEKKKLKKLEKSQESESTDKEIEEEVEKETKEESDSSGDDVEENLNEESESSDDEDLKTNEKNTDSETENPTNKINGTIENESLNVNKVKVDNKMKLVKSKKVGKELNKSVDEKKSKTLLPDKQKEQKVTSNGKSDNLESKKSKKKKVVDVTKAISEVATVKKFADILMEEESNTHENQEPKIDPKVFNSNVEKEVDPFFVTENGDSNFLSVAPRKRNIVPEENKKMDFIQFNPERGPPNKFSKNNDFKFDANRSSSKSKTERNDKPRFDSKKSNYKERKENQWNGREKKGSFNKFNDDRQQKPMSRKERRAVDNKVGEHLHPSWEAKKKQQDALKQGFQGKKIVFGDD